MLKNLRFLVVACCGLVFFLAAVGTSAADLEKMPCGVQPEKLKVINDNAALRENKKYVQFKNNYYEFRLQNGKTRKFRATIEVEGSDARYLLADYLKLPGLYWLIEFYPDSESSTSFTLLDDVFGIEYKVDGIPLFHASCKRFITVDMCDMNCSGQVAIWEKTDGYQFWRQVWSFVPYDYWVNNEVRWVSDDEVLVTKETYKVRNKQSSGTVRRSFIIKLTDEGWKMRELSADAKQ